MTTRFLVVFAVILLCCGLYWLMTRGSEKTRQIRHETRRFAGVAIQAGPHSSGCSAVRAIEGQRFLSLDAPIIPLNDCDAAQCSCRYVRYDDRREGEDRRTLAAAASVLGGAKERRINSGRRETDSATRGQ